MAVFETQEKACVWSTGESKGGAKGSEPLYFSEQQKSVWQQKYNLGERLLSILGPPRLAPHTRQQCP